MFDTNPRWLDSVEDALDTDAPVTTVVVAVELSLLCIRYERYSSAGTPVFASHALKMRQIKAWPWRGGGSKSCCKGWRGNLFPRSSCRRGFFISVLNAMRRYNMMLMMIIALINSVAATGDKTCQWWICNGTRRRRNQIVSEWIMGHQMSQRIIIRNTKKHPNSQIHDSGAQKRWTNHTAARVWASLFCNAVQRFGTSQRWIAHDDMLPHLCF